MNKIISKVKIISKYWYIYFIKNDFRKEKVLRFLKVKPTDIVKFQAEKRQNKSVTILRLERRFLLPVVETKSTVVTGLASPDHEITKGVDKHGKCNTKGI